MSEQVKIADARDNLARSRGKFGGEVNAERATRYKTVIGMLCPKKGDQTNEQLAPTDEDVEE